MPLFRYPYSPGSPPAPAVLLNLSHPTDTALRVENLPALVDSGADQSVVPDRVILALRLDGLDLINVQGYDGSTRALPIYLIRLQVRDLPPVEVEVIGGTDSTDAILGRDVLNRYTIVLNGPAGRLTVSDDPTP